MSYLFDPEVAAVVPYAPAVDLTDIPATRAMLSAAAAQFPQFEPTDDLILESHEVPGAEGEGAVEVLLLRSAVATSRASAAVLLWFHGGGFVLGDARESLPFLAAAVQQTGMIGLSINYRLAPETQYPGPINDGLAVMRWMRAHSEELGIDLKRIALGGQSAGGAHAAGLALKLRDQGLDIPRLLVLDVPVIDDRSNTESAREYIDTPVWHRQNAELSWDAYLGEDHGDAPIYAAPGRAESLVGLPATIVTVNQFDPLRDDAIEFARRLSHAGIAAELHLYPGTFHCSSGIAVQAGVSQRQQRDLIAALERGLAAESAGDS